MIKAQFDNELWMVQQHHHAQVSGFLAAHWGGNNGFSRPGHFPGATEPARWRDEVVLGIAEHDNGWWETEAMPLISERDGLPVGVGDAATPTSENEFSEWRRGGFDRWRRGIQRIEKSHPYGALLISLHAYWLYAVNFRELVPSINENYRHFVFGATEISAGLVGDEARTRSFLQEMSELHDELKLRISREPVMAEAIKPEHLEPHVRLLQLMDSMSLYLSLNDEEEHELKDVPRGSWSDRCSSIWRKLDPRTIGLAPYPFAVDQLNVSLPVRVIHGQQGLEQDSFDSPITTLHGTALQAIEFVFTSL
jgi:hypothetical protein